MIKTIFLVLLLLIQPVQASGADGEVVYVATWEEFQSGYNNPEVSRIVLLNDLAFPASSGLAVRRTSIEIDGQGHTLSIRGGGTNSLRVNQPMEPYSLTNPPVFHLHSVHLDVAAGISPAFVNGSGGSSTSEAWIFRFGNITTSPAVQRVARAQNARIELYGQLHLDTRAENFYAGSVVIADGTYYVGNINHHNYSVIWFNNSPNANSTGASAEFTIGRNATVRFRKTGSGTNFPAVFDQWDSMTVGENSMLDIQVGGSSIGFARDNATFTAHSGAVVYVRGDASSGPLIRFRSDEVLIRNPRNNQFLMKPGSSLYVIGEVNGNLHGAALIDMDGVSDANHSFVLSEPASFDIQNRGTGAALRIGRNSSFHLSGSDFLRWQRGENKALPANAFVPTFSYFTARRGNSATNHIQTVSSSVEIPFGGAYQFRRMAGLNQAPVSTFIGEMSNNRLYVTGKVQLGVTPRNSNVQSRERAASQAIFASAEQVDLYADLGEGFFLLAEGQMNGNELVFYYDLTEPINSEYLELQLVIGSIAHPAGEIAIEGVILLPPVQEEEIVSDPDPPREESIAPPAGPEEQPGESPVTDPVEEPVLPVLPEVEGGEEVPAPEPEEVLQGEMPQPPRVEPRQVEGIPVSVVSEGRNNFLVPIVFEETLLPEEMPVSEVFQQTMYVAETTANPEMRNMSFEQAVNVEPETRFPTIPLTVTLLSFTLLAGVGGNTLQKRRRKRLDRFAWDTPSFSFLMIAKRRRKEYEELVADGLSDEQIAKHFKTKVGVLKNAQYVWKISSERKGFAPSEETAEFRTFLDTKLEAFKRLEEQRLKKTEIAEQLGTELEDLKLAIAVWQLNGEL